MYFIANTHFTLSKHFMCDLHERKASEGEQAAPEGQKIFSSSPDA